MDKNKIKIIIISAAFIITALIVTIVIIINNNDKYKKTVFLGSSTRITINNNKMIMSSDDIVIEKQNVKIISGNKTIDGYVLSGDDEDNVSPTINNCLAYTEDGKRVNFETSLIAYTKDLKVNFIPINNEYLNDIDILEDYFEENNYDTALINLDYLKVSYLDIDRDSKYEYIYSVGFIYNGSKYNSIVLMEKDSEYYLISKESGVSENEDIISLEMLSVLDFNEQNNYYFVIKKWMSIYGPDHYDLYKFDGERFNKVNHSE